MLCYTQYGTHRPTHAMLHTMRCTLGTYSCYATHNAVHTRYLFLLCYTQCGAH